MILRILDSITIVWNGNVHVTQTCYYCFVSENLSVGAWRCCNMCTSGCCWCGWSFSTLCKLCVIVAAISHYPQLWFGLFTSWLSAIPRWGVTHGVHCCSIATLGKVWDEAISLSERCSNRAAFSSRRRGIERVSVGASLVPRCPLGLGDHPIGIVSVACLLSQICGLWFAFLGL